MSTASRSFDIAVSRPSMAWWGNVEDSTWTKVACGSGAAGLQAWQKGSCITEAWADPTLEQGAATNDGGRPNIFAYSGGALDQNRGELWAAGGGHGAYPGNEPYVCHLFSDTPYWEAMANPSPGAYLYQGHTANGPGQYASDIGINGAPQAAHTYHRPVFANDKFWLPGLGGQQWGGPYPTTRIFSFDRVSRAWSAHGYMLTDADNGRYSQVTEDTSCFYYPAEDVIVASLKGSSTDGDPHTVFISPYNGAVVEKFLYAYPTSYGLQQSCAKLIKGTSKVLFISENYFLSGQSGGTFLWDVANPAANPTRLTVTDNTGGLGWRSYAASMAWDTASDAAFIQRNFGEVFVKLAPDTPGNYSGAWTASVVTPDNVASPTRTIPPTYVWDSRPYSRWDIIDDVGDGRSAIVWQPDSPLEGVYVFAIPSAGL